MISSESDGKTGYYMDSYGPSDNCNMANHTSGNNVSMATTASTATAGLYEPHPVNYAMKPEKNLPPTPPGKYILLLICFARIDFSDQYHTEWEAWDMRCNEKSISSEKY